MDIKQVNANSPEAVYVSPVNVDADSITTGMGVAWCFAAASANGVNVVKTDSDGDLTDWTFMGIAVKDFAANQVGRVCVQGMVDSVYLSNVGSSVTITIGDPLVPGKQPGGLFSAAPTFAAGGFKYVLAISLPVAVSANGYASGIVRGPLL